MASPFEGLLPLPYLNAEEILADEGNRAEFCRLKSAGHYAYVRKLGGGEYEIVDGGMIDSSAVTR